MRPSPFPVLAISALLAGGWLGGCSQPTNDAVAAQPTRDVSLVEPAVPESPLVSELEAGKPRKANPQIRRTAPAAEPRIDPTARVAFEQAPTVSATATAVPELVQAPMPASPADEPVVLVGRGVEPSYGSGPSIDYDPSPSRRNPTVIIRGGRGGVDDDCDLHRPGMRRFPMAINQVAPPRMSFPRGGIR